MVFNKGKLKRKLSNEKVAKENENDHEKVNEDFIDNIPLKDIDLNDDDSETDNESDIASSSDEHDDGSSESTVYSDSEEFESDEEEEEINNTSTNLDTVDSESAGEKKDTGDVQENNHGSVISKEDDYEEYASHDTSDEEDIRNTVGNIPMNWYDEYEHIGYDWEGKKILKPNQGDQIDMFLKKMEDPNFWRTVKDPQTGQDVVLSDKDIELIKRIESHKIPDKDYDDYAPWVEWFTSEVMEMPLRKFPEHKRSFLPSKDEMKKVSKYVHAMKMGWMKTRRAMKLAEKRKLDRGPQFYMLWHSDDAADEMRRIHNHIPAPKRPLPDHSESYNPPEEYLFNQQELKKWNREKKSIGNKKLHFVPQKYNSLREVPSYKRFIRERFLRCLDLYMCPRAIKMRLTIEPEDLLPKLPTPKDLQPFPTVVSVTYTGHTDMVRSITIDPFGQYLASASDDSSVKFWEVSTGRCLKTIPINGVGKCITWCPNQAVCLVAVAVERRILLINPQLGDSLVVSKTDDLLDTPPPEDKLTSERIKAAVQWEHVSSSNDDWNKGIRIVLHHFKEVKQVSWHGRGDYFATVMPDGENRSVLIHQLSRRRSQLPFSKPKGLVQAALFHPIKPLFFIATQRNIRIYDLVKQEMVKKLMSNSKWISHMAIHPGGDNVLVGTYDRKVLWFDLDLSTKPYKSLALHNQAVRSVAFHKKYPLFASTSDDQSLIVSHGMVYNDLLQNALIVPVKRFSNHEMVNDFSIFDVLFHPYQPWVFTSGADGKIILYT
ncbi:ribosome biogenesis protein BOP1 homolog [Halyomorpha halys]|uniref:ribosome biogenesis protein BOP1 homolog n=1 Tax=Halyomorpha halys TaxID=286706 RepID=UPI0006D5242D|nr:ribosome biogenesis protein BOP1 homolog [Halyomorpha halys]